MSTKPTIAIKMSEAFAWFAGKAHDLLLSPIPDSERVGIMLKRLAEEVDDRRRLWQQALAEVVKIQNPESQDEGALPRKKARLELVNANGRKWGQESKEATGKRKEELQAFMQAASQEIEKLEADIKGLEEQLKIRSETLQLAETTYKKANADYAKLKAMAPALVAQTEALKRAQADKMAQMEESARSPSTDPSAVLAGLSEALEEAKASNTAAAQIQDDDQLDHVDLDDVMEKEAAAGSQATRIADWTK